MLFSDRSRQILFNFRFRFFGAESGAKVSTFSETSKSFSKNILKYFFEEPFSLALVFDAKAVAKVRQVFETTKSFGEKF